MGCAFTSELSNLLQICAVLAAVTEVIRAQGGTESETEYFGALVSVKDGEWGKQILPDGCRILMKISMPAMVIAP